MSDLAELHDLAVRIAPELSGADLRLLSHQPDWPLPRGATACAIRGRHLAIRDYLRSIGQWSGSWGSYVVFAAEPTIGTLLHELGHLLPARPPSADDELEPTNDQRGYQAGQLLAWAAGPPAGDPWRGHDARWIRRVLHLHHRAESWLDQIVDVAVLNCAGDGYGLSFAGEYRFQLELSGELRRLARASFSQIDSEPLPAGFLRLFCRDVSDFYRDQLSSQESCI